MQVNLINRSQLYLHLPLLCMVLFESHIQFLMLKATTSSEYILIALQLLIESLPFFVAHHLTQRFLHHKPNYQTIFTWLLGFLCYPLLSILISSQMGDLNNWSLLTGQGWILATIASTAWFINHALKTHNKTASLQFISRLFSLNNVIVLLLAGWALIMAGVFNSQQNPDNSDSLNAIIVIDSQLSGFSQFLTYLWQFLIVAALIGSIYLINRYGLIRQVLAKQGVLAFVSAALICIIVITPIFASLVLLLPVNNPEVTFFLADEHQIFAPVNYQFLFWLLAISTPLILVFERQQQDTALAQIAKEQTSTELRLLQQQINPHFLFNTLNNLYGMTLTKSDKAPHLVVKLSNLLRYTVYEGQKEQVTLAQEVAYLQDYIALQQIRSNDRCSLDLVWPEAGEKYTLPPLLIIMLLENAFKYGVEPTIKDSHIQFHMQLNKNILSIICVNPIFENSEVKSGGLGLENLRRRLELLYPGKYALASGPEDKLWKAEMTLELTPC